MSKHKIHLEYCARWQIRKNPDTGTEVLVGIFDGEEALNHALGAAKHLWSSGVLDSMHNYASKSASKTFVHRSGADYELKITDVDDQRTFHSFTRSRYPEVYQKIAQDTNGEFAKLIAKRAAIAQGGFVQKLEEEKKGPKGPTQTTFEF